MAQVIGNELVMSYKSVELTSVDPDLIYEFVKTNKLTKRDFTKWFNAVTSEAYSNGAESSIASIINAE